MRSSRSRNVTARLSCAFVALVAVCASTAARQTVLGLQPDVRCQLMALALSLHPDMVGHARGEKSRLLVVALSTAADGGTVYEPLFEPTESCRTAEFNAVSIPEMIGRPEETGMVLVLQKTLQGLRFSYGLAALGGPTGYANILEGPGVDGRLEHVSGRWRAFDATEPLTNPEAYRGLGEGGIHARRDGGLSH
jgi:hypothetical protein